MTKIEDQRMTQRNGFGKPGLRISQAGKQTFVLLPGLEEVSQQFGTFLFNILAGEQ